MLRRGRRAGKHNFQRKPYCGTRTKHGGKVWYGSHKAEMGCQGALVLGIEQTANGLEGVRPV